MYRDILYHDLVSEVSAKYPYKLFYFENHCLFFKVSVLLESQKVYVLPPFRRQ